MPSVESDKKHIVRLNRDEDVFASLEAMANEFDWQAAHVSGIGAVKGVVMGAFDLKAQGYTRKDYPGVLELLSVQGNMTRVDGAPFFHLHAVLSDHDCQCVGGHLFSMTVAVTCEIIVTPLAVPLTRSYQDDGVNLKLIDFSHCLS